MKNDQPYFVGEDSAWTVYKSVKPSPPPRPQPPPRPFRTEPDQIRGKDSISTLNELYKCPLYVISDRDAEQMVTINITLENRTFTCRGLHKKDTKMMLATEVVNTLRNLGLLQQREREAAEKRRSKLENNKERNQERETLGYIRKNKERKAPSMVKNSIMALNDRFKSLTYHVLNETGSFYNREFVIAVGVKGNTFNGSGKTKQKAKMMAAENALRAFGWWTDELEKNKKVLDDEEQNTESTRIKSSFVKFYAEGEAIPTSAQGGHDQRRGGRGGVGGGGRGRGVWKFGVPEEHGRGGGRGRGRGRGQDRGGQRGNSRGFGRGGRSRGRGNSGDRASRGRGQSELTEQTSANFWSGITSYMDKKDSYNAGSDNCTYSANDGYGHSGYNSQYHQQDYTTNSYNSTSGYTGTTSY